MQIYMGRIFCECSVGDEYAVLFSRSPDLHEGLVNCVGYHFRNHTTARCAFTNRSILLLSMTLLGVVDYLCRYKQVWLPLLGDIVQ